MPGSQRRRTILGVGGTIALIVLAGMGGWLFVVHELTQRVLEMLGPLGTAERIDVSFNRITLTRVHLRASQNWPAADVFRAERVVFDLDMRALLSDRVHVLNVRAEGYYLSVVRSADGHMLLLANLSPSAREANGQSLAAATRASGDKLIDHVALGHGTIEFFDQTVQKPAYRILITDVRAT